MKYFKGITEADFLPDGLVLPCYSMGDLWNGWGCPAFEFDVAKKLAEVSELDLFYNPESDCFECRPEDANDEVFEPSMIEFEGKKVKVYHIGAFSWAWEPVREEI